MPRKLKVFRTPTGFHDAYVAAPSRKAALDAWGADADLFARGVAEEVTEPALMKAPLADPGTIIRVPRGTPDEHLAALPATKTTARPKPKPRPSRAGLDAAEAAIERSEHDHKARLRELANREAALARERREAEREHARKIERLEKDRDDARATYDCAIKAWRA